MKYTNGLVSVCLAVFNDEKYILAALRSIQRQTYRKIEIIVVDDFSTDATYDILNVVALEDPRITLLKNVNAKGLIGARTTAIERAKGEFVAFMDSDDISLPNRFARQIHYLETHPEVDFCGTWVKTFGRAHGNIWRLPEYDADIKAQLLFNSAIANPTIMFRHQKLVETGQWYSTSAAHAEDYELLTRLIPFLTFANVPEVLFYYRTHDKNIGTIFSKEQEFVTSLAQSALLTRALGLLPREDDMRIHRKLGQGNLGKSEQFQYLSEVWLNTLLEANEAKKAFSHESLKGYIKSIRDKFPEPEFKSESQEELAVKTRNIKTTAKRLAKLFIPASLRPVARRVLGKVRNLVNSRSFAGLPIVEAPQSSANILTTTSLSKIKIGMAVLAHERPAYLEACLNSLFKTELSNLDVTFLLCDDGSTDPRVREIIEKPRDLKYRIIRKFFPKGPNNAGAAINRAMKYLSDQGDFDIIGWSDPDALYHPSWLENMLKICLWARENHAGHRLGPFSSFNSSDVEFHCWEGQFTSPFGDYVVKRQMGMLNYFFLKEDFKKLGNFAESENDETLKTIEFESRGIKNFCTKNSYVEHIGQESILNKWRPKKIDRAVFGLNLIPTGWGSELEEVGTLGYFKDVKGLCSAGEGIVSNFPLDVVIFVVPKDCDILPICVQSIRKNLKHPIKNIYIVAPDSKDINIIAERLGCIFVDEDTVLPLQKKDIEYTSFEGVDRSGWLFKQLLIFGIEKTLNLQNYYVIDADTLLVTPQVFEKNNKLVLLHSDEFHVPYFDVYHNLIGSYPEVLLSFVAHQMIFSKEIVTSLKLFLEERFGTSWIQAILDCTDYSSQSGFSEYELYGNWALKTCKNQFTREYWFNFSENKKAVPLDLDFFELKYGSRYRSVSLHSYNAVETLEQ